MYFTGNNEIRNDTVILVNHFIEEIGLAPKSSI